MLSDLILILISLLIIGGLVLALGLYYYTITTKWCKSNTCLVGKTVIVTGANTGIGFETAADFAKRGAKIILACRNSEKGELAKRRMIEDTGNPNIVLKIVDLESFESVRNFAKDINETESRLDILVNNAGCLYQNNSTMTEDGLIRLMKINYFSLFLLTLSLLDLLEKSGRSRIVNLTSLAAKYAKLDPNKLHKSSLNALDYANSKLCIILFTRLLAKKLTGTGVTTFSVHPGVVHTELFEDSSFLMKMLFKIAGHTILRTSEQGAQTSIYLAVTKGIEKYSGENFINCKLEPPYDVATVPGLGQDIWKKSEEIVKLKCEHI